VKTVVHLAGLAHEPDRATSDVSTFRRVNAGGTATLAAAAGTCGIRRFIYVSTVLVHGRSSPGRPLTEDDPFRPDGPYATSKVDAEEHVRRLADAAGMEWVILRPPMVYGPGARGNFRRLHKLVASGVPLPLARASAPRSLIGVDNFRWPASIIPRPPIEVSW
jgi:UDP-glucose 4-epimerase